MCLRRIHVHVAYREAIACRIRFVDHPRCYSHNSIFPLRPSPRGYKSHVKSKVVKRDSGWVQEVVNVLAMSDSMPSLQTASSIDTRYDHGSEDVIRFCSLLAQIEIASCFRNDTEPLFPLVSRLLATAPSNPQVGSCVNRVVLNQSVEFAMLFQMS